MKTITITALLLLGSVAYAQTVDQVAAEVDQVELTVDQVDAKTNKNATDLQALKGGLPALETRVAAIEANPVDPTVASRLSTVEAKVAALETSPGGPSQAEVDALAARVTTLETAQVTVPTWVARDSLGTYISSWYDRGAVGLTFVTVAGVEIRVNVNPDSIDWYGVRPSGGTKYYLAGCTSAPYVKIQDYHPADLDSGDFFLGLIEGEIVTRADGTAYVARVDTSAVIPGGDLYVKRYDPVSGALRCEFNSRGTDVYQSVYVFDLPTYVPPITIGLE